MHYAQLGHGGCYRKMRRLLQDVMLTSRSPILRIGDENCGQQNLKAQSTSANIHRNLHYKAEITSSQALRKVQNPIMVCKEVLAREDS